MKIFSFIWLFSPAILVSQVKVKKPEVVFDQLIGTWQFGNKLEFETWNKVDHVYYALVYSLEKGDTTVSEKFRIYKEKGKYYLEQRVVLNNISSLSKYKLVDLEHNLMVFENKELIFPQKIGYEWLSTSLLAVVQEGKIKDKIEFFEFSYTKVK